MQGELQTTLDLLIQTRVNFRKLLESIPEEKLFVIPEGYKNNIIWNFAHNIVTQQALLYRLAGLPMSINAELLEKFKKGTEASSEFVPGLKDEVVLASYETLEQLQLDILTPDKFANYQEYPTSYGVELKNFNQAMQFNNMHEALHFGYAMALRKLV